MSGFATPDNPDDSGDRARPVRAAPLWDLVVSGIAAFLLWAHTAGPLRTGFDGVQQRPQNRAAPRLPPNIPLVEPLILRELSPDIARQLNAQTPFTKEPIPPAQPFYLPNNIVDQERATDCLASAIWYEAGAETLGGRKAVAQVVLNRVRHPAFPKTVCGVVFQGQDRRTGCQFTFTCDGAMRRIPTPSAWALARGLARIMLSGEVYRPVGMATHYHTEWVLPNWSGTLDKVHREHSHLFFRWKGWWGTPPAFRGRYAGREPIISRLKGLSSVHDPSSIEGFTLPDYGENVAGDTNALPAGLGGASPSGVPANPYGLTPTYQNATADQLVFIVTRRFDPGMMLSLALFSCSVKPYCKVMIWSDPRHAPIQMPASDTQLQAMTFSYLRNRATGIDKALWNCDVFPRQEPSQCMKSRELKGSARLNPRATSAATTNPSL